MTDVPAYPRLRLGTAPDSWGVWFPDDPAQVPGSRYLDEAAAAGYRWTELGPYGYLPTDPARLRAELETRGLAVTGGTVVAALHRGVAALEEAKRACALEAETITPLGARHLVILPEGFTEADRRRDLSSALTDDGWAALNDGMSELGRYVRDELGCVLVFHSHADTHVAAPDEIERFLAGTDPATVHLCLDTGHVAYCGGDPLQLIRDHGDRVAYVHLKSVDPAVCRRVAEAGLDFGAAVKLGAMVEPELGEPDMPPILSALAALDRDLFCIVEQDLYPCPPDVPLPIARRTFAFYEAAGVRVAE
jgi:inosose dehydratase